MNNAPALTTERGGRQGRKWGRAAAALGLGLTFAVTACSGAPPSEQSPATHTQDEHPLLRPRKVGRVVVMFAQTTDAKPSTADMRTAMSTGVRRVLRGYHEATLGAFSAHVPIFEVPAVLALQTASVQNRCSASLKEKDDLTTQITAQAQAAATATGTYRAKPGDLPVVIFGSAESCGGPNGDDIVGVGTNNPFRVIIYNGNDPYENITTLTHEFGHALWAAGESGELACAPPEGTRVVRLLGERCSLDKYGDASSIMGQGSYVDHDLLTGWELYRLGAIPEGQIAELSELGAHTLRLEPLLAKQKRGIKLIKIPLHNALLHAKLGVSSYLLELSGTYIDHDMLRCEDEVACVKKTRIPQGVSLKLYAIPADNALPYRGAWQIPLRPRDMDSWESGATAERAGKTVFEDTDSGVRIDLMDFRSGSNPASGGARVVVHVSLPRPTN